MKKRTVIIELMIFGFRDTFLSKEFYELGRGWTGNEYDENATYLCAPANPAGASRLQSSRPMRWFTEVGSIMSNKCGCTMHRYHIELVSSRPSDPFCPSEDSNEISFGARWSVP